VSNSINSLTSPEDNRTEPDSAGGGRMLVTILLLICALVLTSIMMIHYSMRMQGSEEGISSFSFADLKGTGQKIPMAISSDPESEAAPDDEQIVQNESINEKFGKLLQSNNDQVRWPKIKVTGLGSSKGGDGDFAIINGKQLHPGQTGKDGIKLIEVHTHDIVVEYMGEQKSFPLDLKD